MKRFYYPDEEPDFELTWQTYDPSCRYCGLDHDFDTCPHRPIIDDTPTGPPRRRRTK